MKTPTLYLNLCAEFFDLDKPVPHIVEYAFYNEYLANATGPILEPMCGTGRYFIPFLENGYDLEGFDASPFMLNALKQKCAEKNIHPKVWEQFLEDVNQEKKYNLIFIPDSSFCLFLDTPKIKQCLQTIYDLLQPGGTFVFDVETVYSVPDHIGLWHGKLHTKENGQQLMLSTLPLPITNNIATVICRYELIEKTEIIKAEVEHFQIKLYEPTEMDALLEEIGFTTIKRIKTYCPGIEPSPRDHTIAYECKK